MNPELTATLVNTLLAVLRVIQPVLSLAALLSLRRQQYQALVTVLWVLVIVLMPLWGAVAFFLVARPETAGHS